MALIELCVRLPFNDPKRASQNLKLECIGATNTVIEYSCDGLEGAYGDHLETSSDLDQLANIGVAVTEWLCIIEDTVVSPYYSPHYASLYSCSHSCSQRSCTHDMHVLLLCVYVYARWCAVCKFVGGRVGVCAGWCPSGKPARVGSGREECRDECRGECNGLCGSLQCLSSFCVQCVSLRAVRFCFSLLGLCNF